MCLIASKYVKQKRTELNRKIDNPTAIVGDFNTHRTNGQNSRDGHKWSEWQCELSWSAIYQTPHPTHSFLLHIVHSER